MHIILWNGNINREYYEKCQYTFPDDSRMTLQRFIAVGRNQNRRRKRPSFTLIELLLVMGIIAVLSSVVILAVNPRKMLIGARDASRKQSVSQLQKALQQYQVDQGSIPGQVQLFQTEEAAYPVCAPGVPTSSVCINLDALVPTYMASLPRDTAETNPNLTGYMVYKDAQQRPLAASHWLGESTLKNGLMGHWRFGENGGTTVLDSSGNGNHGTRQGPSGTNNLPETVTGKFGYGFEFDGTDDRVLIPNSSTLNINNTDITVSLWVFGTTSWQGGALFHKESQYSYYMNGSLVWADSSSWCYGCFGFSGSVPLSQWVHLAATKNGSTVRLYMNGALVTAKVFGSAITANNNAPVIGCYGSTGSCSNYFRGSMDDVRIYNRALTATEIAELWESGAE